jgi:hypothetical protein
MFTTKETHICMLPASFIQSRILISDQRRLALQANVIVWSKDSKPTINVSPKVPCDSIYACQLSIYIWRHGLLRASAEATWPTLMHECLSQAHCLLEGIGREEAGVEIRMSCFGAFLVMPLPHSIYIYIYIYILTRIFGFHTSRVKLN